MAPATAGTPASAKTSTPARASLAISVSGVPGAKPQHWTLRCDPAGGTHPDPAEACRVLIAAGDPFVRHARLAPCPLTAIPPGWAEVTGTWFGERVRETWDRGDCGMRSADKVIAVIFG